MGFRYKKDQISGISSPKAQGQFVAENTIDLVFFDLKSAADGSQWVFRESTVAPSLTRYLKNVRQNLKFRP